MHLISPSTPSRNAHFSLPILSLTWLAAARLHFTSTTRPLGASNCGRDCLLSLLSSILKRRNIISVLLIPDSWAGRNKRSEDAQKLLPQIGQSHSQSLVEEKKLCHPSQYSVFIGCSEELHPIWIFRGSGGSAEEIDWNGILFPNSKTPYHAGSQTV
ncbi:hypothetical protein BJ166DRAFT_279866 [Pestalotiopsis sp. NC0098]|nr:hypothetical protein BJ166DRAFT_279866 [Pestalotiopsis sp. NC0098]